MEMQKKKDQRSASFVPNKQLRYHRKMRHWTQANLADELYILSDPEKERGRGVISANMIGSWERGEHMPSPFWQKKLCALFATTPDELGLLCDVSPHTQQMRPLEEQKRVLPVPGEGELTLSVPLQAPVADQLPQPDATVQPSGADSLSDSVVLYPQERMLFLPSEMLAETSASSFTLKQLLIQRLVAEVHGRAMYCDEFQMLVTQELRMFDFHQSRYSGENAQLSRRQVLAALAVLPLALLPPLPSLRTIPPHPEEFLPECTASITSCWSLFNGEGLAIVEQTLPAYLSTLVTWARQTSPYQRVAAHLGAQGSLLMRSVAYHHCHFEAALAYANQAVELARLSGDLNLLADALLITANIHNVCEQPRLTLQKSQEAAQLLPEILPPLQSGIFSNLARAYAQNGMREEALHAIGEAHTRFSTAFGEVPCYLSAEVNFSRLLIIEGQTHFALGKNDADHTSQYSKQAAEALGQVQTVSPKIIVPERNRVQITNYQAQAAIGLGDLEETEHYLLTGMQGAVTLKSGKRQQEARANWQAAQKRWPQERKILGLADLFM